MLCWICCGPKAGRNITVVAVSRVILHDDAVFAGRAALTKIMQYRSSEYRGIRRCTFFSHLSFFTMIRALDAGRIHHNDQKREARSCFDHCRVVLFAMVVRSGRTKLVSYVNTWHN